MDQQLNTVKCLLNLLKEKYFNYIIILKCHGHGLKSSIFSFLFYIIFILDMLIL